MNEVEPSGDLPRSAVRGQPASGAGTAAVGLCHGAPAARVRADQTQTGTARGDVTQTLEGEATMDVPAGTAGAAVVDGVAAVTSLAELERSECLALLGSVPVGRLVHHESGLPTVTPVNFVALPEGVYLWTKAGSAVHRLAVAGAVVAFEADDYDPEGAHGWSVLVHGRAALVQDSAIADRVALLGLRAWAGGQRTALVRITVELVDGRRVGAPVLLSGAGRRPTVAAPTLPSGAA